MGKTGFQMLLDAVGVDTTEVKQFVEALPKIVETVKENQRRIEEKLDKILMRLAQSPSEILQSQLVASLQKLDSEGNNAGINGGRNTNGGIDN
jgi:cell division septum initiation protein DivIVA